MCKKVEKERSARCARVLRYIEIPMYCVCVRVFTLLHKVSYLDLMMEDLNITYFIQLTKKYVVSRFDPIKIRSDENNSLVVTVGVRL